LTLGKTVAQFGNGYSGWCCLVPLHKVE